MLAVRQSRSLIPRRLEGLRGANFAVKLGGLILTYPYTTRTRRSEASQSEVPIVSIRVKDSGSISRPSR